MHNNYYYIAIYDILVYNSKILEISTREDVKCSSYCDEIGVGTPFLLALTRSCIVYTFTRR